MKHLNWSKRLVAGLLAVVLILSVLPTALAEETEQTQAQCTCAPVEGVHDAACPLYEAPGAEDGAAMPSEEADSAEETENSAAESEDADPAADPAEDNDATEAGDTDSAEQAENDGSTEQTESTETIASETPALFAATPRAGTPTLSGDFTNGTTSTALVSSGEAIAEDWDYEDGNQYLNINIAGLDDSQTYTLEVIMDEAVYAAQIPASQTGCTVSFKQGKKLPANGEDNVYLHDRSGTITYTISKSANISLGVQFYYDTVLWNRDAGARLCWNEGPLIDVVLKDSYGNELGNIYLSNATAAKVYGPSNHEMGEYSDPPYTSYPVVNQHIPFNATTNTTTSNAEVVIKNATTNVYIRLRGYSDASYFEHLRMTINLPTCQNVNGKKYSMEVYDIVFPDNAVHSNIPYTVDSSQEGKYIIEFENLYLTQKDICFVYLRFTDEMRAEVLAEDATYRFDGTVAYTSDSPQYYKNTLQKTSVANNEAYYGRVAVNWGNKASVIINTSTSAKLIVCSAASAITSNYRKENTVSFLGTYGLENTSGTISSDSLIIEELFDIQDENKIGVTTVTIMSPADKSPVTVEYTLVDENGTLYTDASGNSKFSIVVPNNRGPDTWASKLYRSMLPVEHQKYYFKSVRYELSTIAPGEFFALSQRPRSFALAGYWGYILDDTLMTGAIAKSEFHVYDATTGVEMTNLRRTFTTTLGDTKEASGTMQWFTAGQDAAHLTVLPPSEVMAGESFYINAHWRPDLNQYGTITWLDNTRIGILLPYGMFIDENNLIVNTNDWGYGSNIVNATVHEPIPQDNGLENLWIIEVDPEVLVGYTTEELTYVEGKFCLGFHIKVLTSSFVNEQHLKWYQRIFVAADDFTFTYDRSGKAQDIYDLNNNGKTDDYITGFAETETAYTNVKAIDSSIDLVGSMGVDGDLKVEGTVLVLDATQTVQNDYTFTNNKGGQVTTLDYFIEIPQALESMNGKGSVVLQKAAVASANTLKFLYATEPLTREQAKTYDKWLEETQVTDFSKVTMVKIVLADQAVLENGTVTGVSLSLKFVGDYAVCAGAEFSMYTNGSYTYYRTPYSKTLAQDSTEIKGVLTYTAEVNDAQELTLTAAQGMTPTSAAGVREKTITISTEFIKNQNYTIAYDSIKTHNVILSTGVAIETAAATMSSNEANTIFGIHVKLNNGTAIDLASVDSGSSVNLGSYTGAPSFTFTLFNADAITENTIDRWVSFNIVGDNGVTIPIKISIKRILATIQDAKSTIEAGESYVLLGSTQSEVTIAADSAFTMQFVAAGITNAYDAWNLQFDKPLPKGSTIIMIDWTVNGVPVYAYHRADGSTTMIKHTAFTLMGGNNKLTSIQIGDAKLLFVVDLPDSNVQTYNSEMKLTYTGSGVDSASAPLTCIAAGNRNFSAEFSASTPTVEDTFTLNYSVGDANPDSRYANRVLSLVLKAQDDLPSDAYLLVNGTPYYRTLDQEFVIPLAAANVALTGSINIRLVSASIARNGMSCVLNGCLWVSATSSGTRPFKGELVENSSISITLREVEFASLKVTSISDRSLMPEDFANPLDVTIKVMHVPAGSLITMELQEQLGQGYNTTTTAISTVSGAATYSSGACNISYSNEQESTFRLILNRSGMSIGNYQLLFKILDSNGVTLLEVPYRFIVTE